MIARNTGERIDGEKITYCFGKVNEAVQGKRVRVSLGLNGEAHVARRWRRIGPGETVPAVPAGNHDSLEAASAKGECGKHRRDQSKVAYCAHRAFSGTMIGEVHLEVVVPR